MKRSQEIIPKCHSNMDKGSVAGVTGWASRMQSVGCSWRKVRNETRKRTFQSLTRGMPCTTGREQLERGSDGGVNGPQG